MPALLKKFKFMNSLSFRFVEVSFITCVILYIITIAGSGFFYSRAVENRYEKLCKSVSEIVADAIDADNVDAWLNGKNTHAYVQETNKLKKLSKDIINLDSIAIYQMREDGIYTVYNTKPTGIRSDLGTITSYDSKWYAHKSDFLKGENVDNMLVSDYTGQIRMFCTPVFNSDGVCKAYVCTGISLTAMRAEMFAFIRRFSTIILFILGALFVFMTVYVRINAVSPIKALNDAMKKTEKEGDMRYMETLSEFQSDGGDEIGNILKSSIKVVSDKNEITEKVKAEQRDVTRAFTTLLKKVGADSVNIGYVDYIGEYAEILCRYMQKTPEFRKELTDEACTNIVIAAPLYNVGNMSLPPEILSKDGKLTDEEFELMKSHTINGARIIEEMSSNTTGAGYFETARQIALFHHERWDGKGYPEGLRGKRIPLPARIVTVLDVFEALVTKQRYREAFSPEAAIDIIMRDKGHFDPDILKCFLAVKQDIIEQYNIISKRLEAGEQE